MARIVLVADDSPTIQKRALGILKGEGFEVETVSNGVAAIKRLAVLHPVVILADVSMPGRDGYEVCDFVKRSAELSHVPVLLVASDMEPYDNARGAEVRADGIIKKPFDPHELISLVVKFAERFEADTPTVAVPVAPAPMREPTQEFALSGEAANEAPTLVQHVTPDFSAVSEGVAFSEPTVDETPGYFTEFQAVEMEVEYPAPQALAEIAMEPAPAPELVDTASASEAQGAPVAETPLGGEEPHGPSSYAPPPEEITPSFLESLEAANPEPIFIEEQPSPAYGPRSRAPAIRTMIFRAPLEIAEPVWKDETLSPPPPPESAGATSLEPQLAAEAPVASPEVPMEQPPEPPHLLSLLTATSLDSFSLDDATAGQVHFASEAAELAPGEVAQSAPAEEAPATEIAPPGAVPEAATAEAAPLEAVPEAAAAEAAPLDAVPEPAPPEALAEADAPPPALDWGLIQSVVHRVVVRMSPPALPMEAREEMAKRLADEIVAEISSESSPPQA